ncbi:MAG: hypothetical protein DMF68_08130 [Acidobacteria bacterium]|nr:MAG: hypothetical protein DMF68_08130 [Acidobacteriota bacterium]
MNNRILGIAGSALLIIGLFFPAVSIMGFLSFSYFNLISLAPGPFFTGILLLLLGIASLALALTNRFRLLIVTGVIAIAALAFDFWRFSRGISESAGGGGADAGGDLAASGASIGWGIYVMIIAAIILIVAGAMKSATPVAGPGYGAPPPPPYPPR